MSKKTIYNCGCIDNGAKCKEHEWISMQNIEGLPPLLIDIAYLVSKKANIQKGKKGTSEQVK